MGAGWGKGRKLRSRGRIGVTRDTFQNAFKMKLSSFQF